MVDGGKGQIGRKLALMTLRIDGLVKDNLLQTKATFPQLKLLPSPLLLERLSIRRPNDRKPSSLWSGCFNCGDRGHSAKECKAPRDDKGFARLRRGPRKGSGRGRRSSSSSCTCAATTRARRIALGWGSLVSPELVRSVMDDVGVPLYGLLYCHRVQWVSAPPSRIHGLCDLQVPPNELTSRTNQQLRVSVVSIFSSPTAASSVAGPQPLVRASSTIRPGRASVK